MNGIDAMWNERTAEYGGLQCLVVQKEDATPDRAIVCLHGFGAGASDVAPLADEMVSIRPSLAEKAVFVFPDASLAPPEFRDFGGRAWWPLDMDRLQRAIQQGEFRDLRQDMPELLPAANRHVTDLLSQLREQTGLAMDRIVLAGFSQGAMLACDVALRLPEAPAALVIWSGSLLCEADWKSLAPNRKGLKVLQSHGRSDPILPFEGAKWLREVLRDGGMEVEFHEFPGPHTIPRDAITAAARILEAIPDA